MSRLQITLSDMTSSCIFQSLRACQRHIKDPNSLKLTVCNTNIGIYELYISDFSYWCVLLRRGHSDWSASSGQPSYYFLWPAASGRAGTECDQGCRFTEIIGRAHRLCRALACTTFDFMFVFWKFCSDLRFSTFWFCRKKNDIYLFAKAGMPNIRIKTSVIGRAQRGTGRAQLNIGRASALPGLYKTTPVIVTLF